MAGIDELMAMQQGGGQAPMPQGGGGDPRMAGALQQKLQELMQDPAARAGIEAHMRGGDPRMAGAQVAMQGMQGGGGDPRDRMAQGGLPRGDFDRSRTQQLGGGPVGRGPATDQELYNTNTANQNIRGNLPKEYKGLDMTGFSDEVEPMDDPRQTPMPDPNQTPEMDMVSREIDRKGATFDGVDAPTRNDIERLREAPTDSMVEAFDEKFGDGAAARYMNEDDSDKGKVNPQYDEEAGETSGESESKDY